MQDARLLRALSAQLSRSLGRPPSMEQLCLAACGSPVGDPTYAAFVLQAAPQAQNQLFISFKGYVATQARELLGGGGGAQVGSYSELGQKSRAGAGRRAVKMDDVFLAGTQGLMQAAYRYRAAGSNRNIDTGGGGGEAPSSSSRSYGKGSGSQRLLTYAHFYIRKHMMAAIKDSVYNQVCQAIGPCGQHCVAGGRSSPQHPPLSQMGV